MCTCLPLVPNCIESSNWTGASNLIESPNKQNRQTEWAKEGQHKYSNKPNIYLFDNFYIIRRGDVASQMNLKSHPATVAESFWAKVKFPRGFQLRNLYKAVIDIGTAHVPVKIDQIKQLKSTSAFVRRILQSPVVVETYQELPLLERFASLVSESSGEPSRFPAGKKQRMKVLRILC